MELSAGVWIHLHIPELKSPLAPGFGQTEFPLGQSNWCLRLTSLTQTAPMCPVGARDAWDVRLGEKLAVLLLCQHSGTQTGYLMRVDMKVQGMASGCSYTWPGPPPSPSGDLTFLERMMIMWLVNTGAVDLPRCWICKWQVLTGETHSKTCSRPPTQRSLPDVLRSLLFNWFKVRICDF